MIRFTLRKPTQPLAVFAPDLKWALNLKDLQPLNISMLKEGILKGKVSGYAQISVDSSNANEPMSRVDYFNFTDDGEYILNGYEKTNLLKQAYTLESHWVADIQVSGKRDGFLKVNDARLYLQKIGSGTIEAKLGDHHIFVDLAKGLPTGVPGELR